MVMFMFCSTALNKCIHNTDRESQNRIGSACARYWRHADASVTLMTEKSNKARNYPMQQSQQALSRPLILALVAIPPFHTYHTATKFHFQFSSLYSANHSVDAGRPNSSPLRSDNHNIVFVHLFLFRKISDSIRRLRCVWSLSLAPLLANHTCLHSHSHSHTHIIYEIARVCLCVWA